MEVRDGKHAQRAAELEGEPAAVDRAGGETVCRKREHQANHQEQQGRHSGEAVGVGEEGAGADGEAQRAGGASGRVQVQGIGLRQNKRQANTD